LNKTNDSKLTDQDLLKRFHTDHNNEWLGYLLERYTLLLYGVSMKYLKNQQEAKDAVQQIFLKVITELHKYEVNYFASWIYMIAKNHCLMILRNKQRILSVDEIPEPVSENDEYDPLKGELIFKDLEAALQHLNPDQHTCVRMFYLEKKSYQHISNETGFNLLQVKSYIQNGKRNLRLLLDKKTSGSRE
jgi:RNA polymerase sigma factor (sigma-70 family)